VAILMPLKRFSEGDDVSSYLAYLSGALAGNAPLLKIMDGSTSATTATFIAPRLTTVQRDALIPVTGMIIYNTTTNAYNAYTTSWKVVTVT
jgi:hypothetical protein